MFNHHTPVSGAASAFLFMLIIMFFQKRNDGQSNFSLGNVQSSCPTCFPCICPVQPKSVQEMKKDNQQFCNNRPQMEGVISKEMSMDNTPVNMYFISGKTGEHDIVSDFAIRTGEWETPIVMEIVGKLNDAKAAGNKDPVFLDIGSNIGWFSMQVAVRGFRVYAFDAMRRNGNIFRLTMCENPKAMEKIMFYNVALSNDERLCIVSSDKDNAGNGQIECGETNTDRPTNTKYPNNVVRNALDMVRLDKYVHEPIEVLKIDVEGHELLALQGGGDLFAKGQVKYLTSEISSIREPDGQLLQQLQTWGFQCSVSSFKGPFLYFNKGQELADLQKVVGGPTGGNPMALFSVFCKHKSA